MPPPTANTTTAPKKNPYQTLSLANFATDAQISKAYRALALQYHPDKQRKNNHDPKTLESYQAKFLEITEAKAFLLDAEHSNSKKQYDAKLKADSKREKDEEQRWAGANDRRKRFRDDLIRKEQLAKESKKTRQPNYPGQQREEELLEKLRKEGKKMREDHGNNKRQRASFRDDLNRKEQTAKESKKTRQRSRREDDLLEKLRKEGDKLRENLGQKKKMDSATSSSAASSRKKKLLEERQIRLKWKRSRLSISHSEDSIAKLMKKYGEVESVEMIGDKGNSALVTFRDWRSCESCVEEYFESELMRAFFVGEKKKKWQEEEVVDVMKRDDRDFETMEERRARGAAERETLLHQMEMEDDNGVDVGNANSDGRKPVGVAFARYPPPFPDDGKDFSPLERLEMFERIVLPKCMSFERTSQKA